MIQNLSKFNITIPVSTIPHLEEVKKIVFDYDDGGEDWNTSDALAAIICTGQDQTKDISNITMLYDVDSNRTKHLGENRINKSFYIGVPDRKYITDLKEDFNRLKPSSIETFTAEDIITYFLDEFYLLVNL